MRIRYEDLGWLVSMLEAAKKEQQCNILEEHRAKLADDETVYEFVIENFYAAQENKIDDVLILRCLSERLNKNLRIIDTGEDGYHETLLFSAVRKNLTKSVEYLINSGIRFDVRNIKHYTAAISAMGKCPGCVTLLLEKGVNANETLVRFCSKQQGKQDLCEDGRKLVHFAVSRNDTDSLRILSQHNADLNAQDTQGLSPAHISVIYALPNILLELGKLHVSPEPGF